jgi:hypothetical protein
MDISFPKNLVQAINIAQKQERNTFSAEWVEVCEGFLIEELNSFIQGECLALRNKFNFYPLEHEDWVSVQRWYAVEPAEGAVGDAETLRPLNSWILKDPVAFVPSTKEIQEDLAWRNPLMRDISKVPVRPKTFEELHREYVWEACKQVVKFSKLLQEWVEIGSPYQQEQCIFRRKDEKVELRRAIKVQRYAMADAWKKLELYIKTKAPTFLIEQASGKSFREKKLLDQMRNALSIFQ